MTGSHNGNSRPQALSHEALKGMLHKQALAELSDHLNAGEKAVIVIEGLSGQAFIVTDRHRVLVFKRGMMGGVAFGRKMHSWEFSQIKGITIDVRILNGFAALDVIESNVEELSYWGHGDNDVWSVSNGIPLNTSKEKQIRESAAALRRMLHDYHNPPSRHSEVNRIMDPPTASFPEASQLLRDAEPRLEIAPVRFCFSCGAELRRAGRFCEFCGQKLD